MVLSGKALGNFVIHVGLNDSGLSQSLSAMKNAVRASSSEMRAQMSVFGTLGDHLNKAKIQYEGLTRTLQAQQRVVEEQRRQLQAMGQRTSENASEYDKLTAQIDNNVRKMASLTAQQEKAKNLYDYEKTGIRQNKEELALLNREMDSTVRMYQAQGKSELAARVNTKGLQDQIVQLNEILGKERQELQRIESESGRTSEAYRNQAIIINELQAKIATANNQYKELGNSVSRFGERLTTTGSKISDVGRSMTQNLGMATLAVGSGLGLAAKSAMDFESQMSAVKSVMAPDEVRKYSKELENLAIVQGAKTAYSATQAAQAEEELVKAGVSVKDIIHGGLSGALNLATAGSLNLKDAAEIASTALNAFRKDNLSVSQAADILAGAANASATDVGELKFGLSMVSAVASGVGWSFKDTSTALAEFAQNGLKGSDAGTSLKQMLLTLQPQTDKAAGLMEHLGIITKDGTNLFIDAHGHYKDLADISQVLQDKLGGLTKAQQQLYLKQMFGTDAIRAGNILMREGAKGAEDMASAIGKISAADVAKQKLDNMKGTLEQLRGSLETAGITIGQALLPTIRGLTNDVQKAVDWFNKLDPATQQWIAKAALTTTATLGVGTGLGAMTMAIGGGISMFGKLVVGANSVIRVLRGVKAASEVEAAAGLAATASEAGLLASALPLLTNPIGLTVAGLGALGIGAYAVYHHMTALSDISLTHANVMIKEHDQIAQQINDYDELRAQSALTTKEFGRFVDIQVALKKADSPKEIERLKDEADQLQKKSGLSNKQLSEMVGLNKDLVKNVPGATNVLTEQGNRLVDNTKKAKDYNKALLDRTIREYEEQRNAALGNEVKLRNRIADNQEKLNVGLKTENGYQKLANEASTNGWKATIKKYEAQRDNVHASEQERAVATFNLSLLRNHGEQLYKNLSTIQKQNDKLDAGIEKDKSQLNMADRLNDKITHLILKENGVNDSRQKGVLAIAAQESKLNQQLAKLDELHASGKISNAQYNEGREAISRQIDKLEGVRNQIVKATGNANVLNSVLNKDIAKNIKFTGDTEKDAVRINNALAKEIHKNVVVNVDIPAHAQLNMMRALGVDTNAEGTSNFRGGLTWLAEEGSEAVHVPGGGIGIVSDKAIYSLPKGSSVLPHAQTTKLMNTFGNKLQGFATGLGNAFDWVKNIPANFNLTTATPSMEAMFNALDYLTNKQNNTNTTINDNTDNSQYSPTYNLNFTMPINNRGLDLNDPKDVKKMVEKFSEQIRRELNSMGVRY